MGRLHKNIKANEEINEWFMHVQRAVTLTWKQDTCQIRLLVNRRLNHRWNSARVNNIMIADAWSEGLVADAYSHGGGRSWSQCPRCWRIIIMIFSNPETMARSPQGCCVCFHLAPFSSHAGIDFNIPLQWPSIKHAPALLSTLLKLHCCHTSQWWASDIQPVSPFVSLLAPKQRTSFQRTLETLPTRCCFWSSLITATALLKSILLTLTLCIWCSYKLNRQHESCKINASRWGPWSEIPLFKHIFQR